MSELSLRRRADGAVELRVNGVFVMDDAETSSEQLLARAVCDLGAQAVVVGGLGLGFTLRELLSEPSIQRVVVAELEPQLVEWMRDGTIPGADLLSDPRVEIMIDDVRRVVSSLDESSVDAIVLDVDNGPEFLVHESNEAVYQPQFIETCAKRLSSDGHLCIWSMASSTALTAALDRHFTTVSETSVPVTLQGRDEHYWIVTGSGPR